MRRRAQGMRRYLPAALALLIGVVLSYVFYFVSRAQRVARAEEEFERRAGNVVSALSSGLRSDIEVLEGVVGLFESSEVVTWAEFTRFTGLFVDRTPGIEAIEWVPIVPADRRAAVEAEATRILGFPFRIRPDDSAEDTAKSPDGTTYPIFYITPFEGNEEALGLDLGASPVRAKALAQAARTGAAAATPVDTLVRGGIGYHVALPVQRAGRTVGFIVGVYRLDKEIESSLALIDEPIDFILVVPAVAPGDHLIFQFHTDTDRLLPHPEGAAFPERPPDFIRWATVEVDDVRWSLVLYATPGFLATTGGTDSWIVLAAGLLLTGLLTAYLIVSARRAERMSAINAALEREAGARARVQRNLRESEEEQRFLAETSAILVSSLDYEATLRGIARLALPKLADWSLVHTMEPDGTIRRLEVAGPDPELEAQARRLLAASRSDPSNLENPIIRALRRGKPELLREISPSDIERLAQTPEERRFMEALKLRSAMVVPLVARGRTLGAITFAVTGDRAPYDQSDLELAEELARRAALAVDNARLYMEAQQASQAKSDFLAVMSHELRTPLNAIIGYADLMKLGIPEPPTKAQEEQIARIHASARHLLDLIEEILSFSRLEAAEEVLRRERFDLGSLIRDVVASVEPLGTAKGLAIHVDLPDHEIPVVTDPDKLQRILRNILSNAIKFTEEGEVRVRVRQRDGFVAIDIEDTGIGISSEDLEHIFEPFWQAEAPTTRRKGGTGLGLAVASRLAHLLGGQIFARSEPGKGSVFTVEIPVSASDSRGLAASVAARDAGASAPGTFAVTCAISVSPRIGTEELGNGRAERAQDGRVGPRGGGRVRRLACASAPPRRHRR